MDIYVLDENRNFFTVIDDYISFIWTERYSKCGDFEIYMPVDINYLLMLKKGYYLRIPDSDTVMIIEDIYIDTDIENGNYLTVSGRSIESILDRRIAWGEFNDAFTEELQNFVSYLLENHVINPSDPDRQIKDFVFMRDDSLDDLEFEAKLSCDNIYDLIESLCGTFSVGFKVTLDEDNRFIFKLYSGKDRSYNQNENAYVVFSPAYDNLISSNYIDSDRHSKNVTLVAGKGENNDRPLITVGSGQGLNRRELYTDAKNVSSNANGTQLSEEEYIKLLEQTGTQNLVKNAPIISLEANIDPTGIFKYGEHYSVGDIVQIENEYGIQGTARITEFIRSRDINGFTAYPTFVMIE